MKVALLLHAYQPPTQFLEVTKQISEECYRPLFETLIKNPKSRITLNINGSLTEQLIEIGHKDVLKNITHLVQQGQLELTGSAAYHTLLTTLPEAEIVRQAEINQMINQKYFGADVYRPKGFFLPEMVYDNRVGEIIAKMGFQWLILDETGFPKTVINQNHEKHLNNQLTKNLYRLSGTHMKVFFRDNTISLGIAFDRFRNGKNHYDWDNIIHEFYQHYVFGQESFIVLAMDAETFGHHHKDYIYFLQQFLDHPMLETVKISELQDNGYSVTEITPLTSTWGQVVEFAGKRIFPRWMNPDNPIQQALWKLYNLAVEKADHISNLPDSLDKAICSDTFFWAADNPCWHPQMVERGAARLRDAVEHSPLADPTDKNLAKQIYRDIIQLAEREFGMEVRNC